MIYYRPYQRWCHLIKYHLLTSLKFMQRDVKRENIGFRWVIIIPKVIWHCFFTRMEFEEIVHTKGFWEQKSWFFPFKLLLRCDVNYAKVVCHLLLQKCMQKFGNYTGSVQLKTWRWFLVANSCIPSSMVLLFL